MFTLLFRVLRPDYIEACEKAGNFLPEAEYEWQPLWTDTSAEGAIKAAARNWRTFLSTSKGKAAFDGWNVLLAVDQKRMPGLRRILQAGHATVFTIPEIYQFLGMEDPASQMVSKRNSAVESSSIPIDVPPAVTSFIENDTFYYATFLLGPIYACYHIFSRHAPQNPICMAGSG